MFRGLPGGSGGGGPIGPVGFWFLISVGLLAAAALLAMLVWVGNQI